MTQIPDWLSTTLASDATGGIGALAPWVKSLHAEPQKVSGRALVVGLGRDDNSPMRDIGRRVTQPGTILVVGGAADSRTAILGDLVARELLDAGIVAVVTDGCIRDAHAVADLGLAVWGRGVTAVASRKDGVGYAGGAVPIAGTIVHDGDLVVADGDGVVVWPWADVDVLLQKAEAKAKADERRLAGG